MSAPRRLQRRRTKGWRMPNGAVYVGRPTAWGNPAAVDDAVWMGCCADQTAVMMDIDTPAQAVAIFRIFAEWILTGEPAWLAPLRGRDLVCWCQLDQPCHADVLLELANAERVAA